MKKFLALLVMLPLISDGQFEQLKNEVKKPARIKSYPKELVSGLGIFKVGKCTLSYFRILTADTSTNGRFVFDSAKQEYYSDEYSIANIAFDKLHFRFYEDTLYEIEFDPTPEIDSAFELKFAVLKKEEKKDRIWCIDGLGGLTRYDEHSVFEKFKGERDVDVELNWGYYYDDACEMGGLNAFTILSSRLFKRKWKRDYPSTTKFDKRKRLNELKGL